jgi:hypothetical protein
MPIKTFKGKIADDGVDTIFLHTNNGSTGYKIQKLQIMQQQPGGQNSQLVFTVWKVDPGAAQTTLDFSDNRLLGVAYRSEADTTAVNEGEVIIFDTETFNQDIYLRASDVAGSQPCNYYMELEQVKLDLNENTVATLKDIRNNA